MILIFIFTMEQFVSPHIKLAVFLAVTVSLPILAALALLESGRTSVAVALLALHGALGLGLMPFLARFALHFCVLGELSKVDAFTSKLRGGGFPEPFSLPVEREDEHLLLRLKRNLNWMLHQLKDRENRLIWRLEETDQARRVMEDLSRTDSLTGLFNRRHFEQTLQSKALCPLDPDKETWLLMIDCDKFKQVNDTLGHQTGDEVLRLLARIIRESVREGCDSAFRLGGDEFAVLLPCLEVQARDVAERIRQRFKESNGQGCTLSIGLSSGMTVCGASGICWNQVIARADAAVYAAKSAGGDSVNLR